MHVFKVLFITITAVGLVACSSGENSALDQELASQGVPNVPGGNTAASNEFDLFRPVRVNIASASQSTCNQMATAAMGKTTTCVYGGGCDGQNPTQWGFCQLAPVHSTERTNASAVAAAYQNMDTHFPQAKAAANFLKGLYVKVYNRQPDEAGFYFWLNEHFNNTASLPAQPAQHLTDAIIRSTECTTYINAASNPQSTSEPYLQMLYSAVINRAPDTAGFNYWKNEMINGQTRDQVLNNFYLSQSFYDYVQSMGLNL